MPESITTAKAITIKINLGESSDAREFDPLLNELIHSREYDRAKGLIQKQIEKAKALKKNKDADIKQHNHSAITILGTRGSGKTSFLLSLKKAFKFDPGLHVLKIIDPTLIEDKGHIFLTIISAISEAVEKILKVQETSSSKPDFNKRKGWRDQMTDLADGLPGLDGIGKDNMDGWQDPEFLMDTGMSAVNAARNLAENFDKFLQASLEILEKDAFLLIFDDIDVNAKKGTDVLETIRKYLVTSRVITVLSGDLNLYISVLRNKKWENFGKDLLRYEGEGMKKMPSFYNTITELTSQYLFKVMQPGLRVHLTTLQEKLYTQPEVKMEIISKSGEEGVDLVTFYHRMFNEMGVRNNTQLEVYTTFMLGLPVRTQIQFLRVVKDLNEGNELNMEAISDLFIADLTEKGVNVALLNQTPKYLCAIILQLLQSHHKILDLYQLQPTTMDESLNGSIMAMWMIFARYTGRNRSFLIFDYFIKIAYVRNLSAFMPYRDSTLKSRTERSPDLEELFEIGDVLNDGVLRDVASAIQSYLLGVLESGGNTGPISPFYTRLYSLKSVSKSTRKDQIDTIFNDRSKAECILAFIPCYSSTYANKNESRVMYSIYALLGAIGEIIKRYETVKGDIGEIRNSLKQLSQFRSYIVPDLRDSSSPGSSVERAGNEMEQDELKRDIPNETDKTDELLASLIDHWLKGKQEFSVSTHLLGKMMTRFFYAMNNIADAYPREKDLKLGELFYLQVTAFMNAVLVEDVSENGDITSLNINNTRLSDTIFLDNLRKVIQLDRAYTENLKLSRWLLSCPLFLAYLYLDKENQTRVNFLGCLKEFCGDLLQKESFTFSINHLLDDVGIFSTRVTIDNPADLLNDYEELIAYLKERKIPRSWFNFHKDAEKMATWNNNIIERESAVFGTAQAAVNRIEKFRNFLKFNRDKWK